MKRQLFCSRVYFYSREYALFGEKFREGNTAVCFLANRFVIQNDAAYVLLQSFCRKNSLAILAPVLFGAFHADGIEAFLARARAFVGGNNAFARSDHHLGGGFQCFEIHTYICIIFNFFLASLL